MTVPKYSCTVNRTSGSCTQSCSCYMHNKTETWFSVCCRILPCNKENLCGALVRQSLGLYPIYCVHLRSIIYTKFLHSIVPKNFCYKMVIFFICYYNGNTRLNYVNLRLTLLIHDLLKPELFLVNLILTAVSHYMPINIFVIYTRTHALFAARMTHHATSQDVPTQTCKHNFPRQFLI